MNQENNFPKKNMITFRESFRGYNKDDVNRHLEKLYLRLAQIESEYERAVFHLNEQIKALSQSADSSFDNQKEISRLRAELEAKTVESKGYQSEILLLKNKLCESEELVSELKVEIEGKKDTEKNNQSDNLKDMAKREELYQKMSYQLGDVLIAANESADKIVEDAKAEAVRIRADALKDADEIKRSVVSKADEMTEILNKRIKNMSEIYMSEYSKILAEMQQQFAEINQGLKCKSSEFSTQIASVRAEVGKHLVDDFNNLDKASD